MATQRDWSRVLMSWPSIQSLPMTFPPSLPTRKEVEALLSAAHSLSRYNLVLKQGEPFTPVMLRVHSDPISIIEKVLSQNKGAYTRLQEFHEIGMDLLNAGFISRKRISPSQRQEFSCAIEADNAEKRIVSLCISAALKQDDFETAYSYVTARLNPLAVPASKDPEAASRRGDDAA